MLKSWFLSMMVLIGLSACNSATLQDGYQFGDLTRLSVHELKKLKQYRQDYCTYSTGSTVKRFAIVAIRSQLPLYPEQGICTELDSVLTEAITQKTSDNDIRGSPG